MSMARSGRPPEVTDSEIIEFMRNNEQPVLTAKEIAAEFDISSQAVNKRLNTLHEEGAVVKKRVGSAAVVWWPHSDASANTRS